MVVFCHWVELSNDWFLLGCWCIPTPWCRSTGSLTSCGAMPRRRMRRALSPSTSTGSRAAIGAANASILVTRPPGYVLAPEAEQLDSSRFVAMVGDAQRLLHSAPAEAKTVFDDALGLWRGPVWAEFADLEFLRADVTRLDGLRAMAVEGRADAMLALGRHDELVPSCRPS